MKFSRTLTLLCVALLSFGLAGAVACGEDTTDNQQANDTAQNDGDDDNQNQDNDAECSTDDDCDEDEVCEDGDCVADEDDNGDDDECTDNDDCEGDHEICDDGQCIEGDPYVEPAPATASCEDSDAPARCTEDYTTFDDWGPASYVDQLAIAGEDECCVDFTGDGNPDNELAGIADTLDDIDDINDQIQEGIDDGEISIVLEHDGLEDVQDGEEYDINFLFADDVDDGEATIDPASFEDGTHPHALIPDAEVTDDNGSYVLDAGPGTVVLQLDAGALTDGAVDAELELDINNATIQADFEDTDISEGVGLENGEIGGVLRFEDVFEAINEVAEECGCLGNPETLVEFDDGDAICNLSEDERDDLQEGYDDFEEACDDQGDEEFCADLGQFCPGISVITAMGLADVDTSGDGDADAFTAGITFEASAVEIVGVADENGNGNGD